MKYLDLPFVDKKISRIAFGCDYFGLSIAEEVAIDELEYYTAMGGNILDTAHSYGQTVDEGPSSSERIVGSFIKTKNRDSIFLITKGGHPKHLDKSISRLDKNSLDKDITSSLSLLDTPPDLYFVHRDDENINLEELMIHLNSYIEKGWTKYIGASNWKDERIEEANRVASSLGLQGFTFSELQFSLAKTDRKTWGDLTIECIGEGGSLEFYERTKMSFLAFSSQGKGVFQKVINNEEATLSEKARKRFLTPVNIERIERVKNLQKLTGYTVSQIVLSYITSQKSNAIAIISSSKLSQIKDSLYDTDIVLTQDQIEYLDLRRDNL